MKQGRGEQAPNYKPDMGSTCERRETASTGAAAAGKRQRPSEETEMHVVSSLSFACVCVQNRWR